MRVLLAPHGTRGDVQPMLALAEALRARGHVASFVAPDNFLWWLRARGFDAVGNGIDIEQLLRTNGAALDSFRWQARHFADVLIPTLFKTVSRAAPDAELIVGSGVQVAAAAVAEARGVPYATAIFCPCAVPSSATPPPTIRMQSLPEWANRVLWAVGRPLADLLLRRPIDRQRARLGLAPDATPLATLMGDLIIVAADRDLAPLADDAPEPAVATDAWIFDEPVDVDARVSDFLDRGEPPVYIGFGSMVAAHADDLAKQTLAAVRAVGARAIVAAGWAALDRYIDAEEDVLVVGMLPHAAVLPRVAAVVHHGGAGTTTSAARAGRPQIVVPHILDQFYWAHRVQVLGLGPPPVPVPLVTADILADRVDRALNDPRLAARASALGSAIAPRNGADAAVELLEALYTG